MEKIAAIGWLQSERAGVRGKRVGDVGAGVAEKTERNKDREVEDKRERGARGGGGREEGLE